MRRSHTRRRAGSITVAMLVALGLAACSDDEEDPGPATDGVESPQPASESALREIPLDGTSTSPITWRLPPDVSAAEQPAVLTARRYLATNNLVGSDRSPESLEPLYRGLAVGDSLDISLPWIHGENPTSGQGPVWVWLQTPQPLPDDELLIRTCRDYGWRDVPGDDESVPLPRGQRAEVLELVLRQTKIDGVARWVVTRNHYPLLPDQGAAFERACDHWAQHSPD